jgi:hypothetical protein
MQEHSQYIRDGTGSLSRFKISMAQVDDVQNLSILYYIYDSLKQLIGDKRIQRVRVGI